MSKTLLILRHGKSSWDNSDMLDHDRPLKERGRNDAARMGEILKEEALVPDLIVSSTAERAVHTAEIVAQTSAHAGDVQHSASLYHASPENYVKLLKELNDVHECVLVVGHNPGLEELLKHLTDVNETLPTAALAQVSLPVVSWSELTLRTNGRLENVWRPKELD